MDILSNAYIGQHFDLSGHDPHGLLHAYEQNIMRQVFEKLWAHYPGYNWRVKCNAHPKVGIVSVQLPQLHHSTLGFNFSIDKLASDPGLLIVRRAGGDLLERFNLRRNRANIAEFRDQIARKRVHKITDKIDGGTVEDAKARWVNPTWTPPNVLVPANTAARLALAA